MPTNPPRPVYLLTEYAKSHRNPTNKRIHYVCVPLIAWATIGLLWDIPHPFEAEAFHWSWVGIGLSIAYYLKLFPRALVVLGPFVLGVGLSLWGVDQIGPNAVLISSVTVFVLAWIAQFVGHKIEGVKPSFFQDLEFLLVGPVWIAIAAMPALDTEKKP
jgi:uncharacterized membrane protein YGL010W